ncbi:MAG: MFS transporter [Trichococcus sp.]|uniref:MFS transporter n=1 Tax=Trichococcus sp. TaxID=1985464 RepID=UPI003C534A2D
MDREESFKENLSYDLGKTGRGEVSLKEKLAYGLGDAGCNFVWTVVASFLTLYYTDNVGVSAAVIGTIMLLTRLLDGLSDIAMGIIIDRTNTRWGKARPWILLSAPLMAIGLILLFNVPANFSETGKIAYISVTYVLLAVVIYTACNLSYSTLLSLITPKQEERTSMSSIRFIFTMVTVLIISVGTMPLVGKIGWGGMSVLYGIISMLFLLITFSGTKERFAVEETEVQNKLSVRESLKYLFKNKYFIYTAVLFVLNYASSGAAMGIAIYYAKDVLGNIGIFGTLTMAGLFPMILGLFLFPKFASRFGKWKCFVVGYLLQAIGYLMIFLMPTNLTVVIIGLVIKGIGAVPHTAGMFALVADVVDYGEWKHGVRIDGLTYSATSFGMKVGTGIGSAVVGWGLAFGKYDAAAAVQSESALEVIKALYTYIPLAMIAIGLIVLAMSNLDKIYPTIMKDLEERRNNQTI